MGSTSHALGGAGTDPPATSRRLARAAKLCVAGAAVLLGLASVGASTSGAPLNERVVAVYDFAVVDRADRLDHVVAFVAFTTPSGTAGIAVPDVLVATAEHVAGIDPGTARASAEPPALSFSYDARNTDIADVLQRLSAAAPVPVHFALIQSIRPAYPSTGEPIVVEPQRP